MANDTSQDPDFHEVREAPQQYYEDRALVVARDWPPLHEVYLRDSESDSYLYIKHGSLRLSKQPKDRWYFVSHWGGSVIRNVRKGLDIVPKRSGTAVDVVQSKEEVKPKWEVRVYTDGGRVSLTLAPVEAKAGSYLRINEKKVPEISPGEMVSMKNGRTIGHWIVEEPQDLELDLYTCPACEQGGLSEDALWYHWAHVHGRDAPKYFVCPICYVRHDDASRKGDPSWGFGNHLFHNHGPPMRKPTMPGADRTNPTYAFSLVIIQHPKTKKFVLVEEGANAGWWLPAGSVDPGEGFMKAAVREAKEEAGIDIELKAILCLENTPRSKGGGRQRMVFYAHPTDPDQPLKSIPDYESLSATWITYEELMQDLTSGKKHLRGKEPIRWFKYVEDGKEMFSLSLLSEPSFAFP